MKKKNWLAALMTGVAALALTLGCVETGPGMDNAEYTGNALHITSIDNGEPLVDVLNGLTPDANINGADINVINDPVGTNDEDSQSAVYLTGYDVQYVSNEPGAVPLDVYKNISIAFYLEPGGSTTFSGWPLVVPFTKGQYVTRGGQLSPPVGYRAIVTIHGVNEWGEKVKAKGEYPLFFADY